MRPERVGLRMRGVIAPLRVVSAEVQTQPMLHGSGTNKAALKARVTGFCLLFMVGRAMVEQAQKHEDQHDDALLTMTYWCHQLVTSAASGLKVERSMCRSPLSRN